RPIEATSRPCHAAWGRNFARTPPRPTPRKPHWATDIMLRSIIARVVDFSTYRHWPVIVFFLLIATGAGVFATRHFAIDTNIDHLLSTELPWRKNEIAYQKAFPQRDELSLVVVQAPTPETTKMAADALAARIAERRDVIRSVRQPGGGEFFARNGLLYVPKDD